MLLTSAELEEETEVDDTKFPSMLEGMRVIVTSSVVVVPRGMNEVTSVPEIE